MLYIAYRNCCVYLTYRLQKAMDKNRLSEVNNETWKYEKADNTTMCKYWIKRKQRYCRHRIADGNLDGFCSDHSTEGNLNITDCRHFIFSF
jgi:hypothetical protein